jgi:hypothetical protein
MPEGRIAHERGQSAESIRCRRAYHASMVDARTADLDELLDPDVALVHVTRTSSPREK